MEIKTVWKYSPETEALRILQCAHQIATGFYRVNNFPVLPHSQNTRSGSVVVRFPDLPYNQISRFWNKAKLINGKVLPIHADNKLISGILSMLNDIGLKKPNFAQTKDLWERIHEEVLSEVWKIMPSKMKCVKKIIIFSTVFGTGASFSFIPSNKKEIHIYLREDRGIHSIVESVLTCLTRKEVYEDLDGNWSESELLVDWLLTKTALSDILQKHIDKSNFVPTIKSIRIKQNARLLKESETFYNKLGVPSVKSPFSINGQELRLNGKPIVNLSNTEKVILSEFVKRSNNTVTFDDIAAIMFKKADDFSLYAISKQVERLRNKLEANGVSGSYIQTLRGQGYLLKN